MPIQEIGLIVGLSITCVGAIFVVYDRFSKPDIEADNKIKLLEQGCKLKHSGIDEKFQAITETLTLIKENHLAHIETRMNGVEKIQERILTTLEERLPRK